MDSKQVYDRQADRIYGIAMVYFKNVCDAEDAVQNVFIKFLESNKQFDSMEHEKAWFIVTTKNYCRDVLKSAWRKKVELGEVPEQMTDSESADYELLRHIYRLPEKYREVLYLYYYEEYTVKEMAEILKRKESTLQTQLATARKKLRFHLEKEGVSCAG